MVQAEYTGQQNLYSILRYCINHAKCRRKLIAHHFGEVWKEADCTKMCDICVRNSSISENDATLICEGFLEVLEDSQRSDQRLTAIKLVDTWKTSRAAEHFSNKTRPTSKQLECVIAHCILNSIIREDYHFTPYSTISYLVLGPKAYAVKTKRLSVTLETLSKPGDVVLTYPLDQVFDVVGSMTSSSTEDTRKRECVSSQEACCSSEYLPVQTSEERVIDSQEGNCTQVII